MSSQLLDFLGGEALRESAPQVYEALSNTKNHENTPRCTGSETNVKAVYLSTEEIYPDAEGVGALQRTGFLKAVPFVAVVSKLYDGDSGRLLDTFNEYAENTTYNERFLLSRTALSKQAAKKSLRLVSSFTWSEDGVHALERTEEFAVSQFADGEPIIEELLVTAPRAKNKKTTLVLYDREAHVTENTDYHYANVLSPNKKAARIMLPFEGKLRVAEGLVITGLNSVEDPVMHLILEKGGTVPYGRDAAFFENQFTISKDGREISWKFDNDWNSLLDLSFFVGSTIVDFSCQFTLDVQKKDAPLIKFHPMVMITSVKQVKPRISGACEIENIMLLWGCVARGTKITMADGAEKPIEAIVPGDRVLSENKAPAMVQDIISGFEERMIFLETENGRSLCATGTHPVKTARGLVRADCLTAADRICTAEGDSRVKYIYEGDYSGEVFSLVLEQSSAIFCGGIIAGDFTLQNTLEREAAAAPPRTPLQEQLSRLMTGK